MSKPKLLLLFYYSLFLLLFLGVKILHAQSNKVLFPESPGIVSYTYRTNFQKDIAATLNIVKGNGITDIEFSNLFGTSADNMRKLIDSRGIRCSSFGVSYDDLMNKTTEVAQNAKILGAEYVRVAWIPHTGIFTIEKAMQAVEDFNKTGKILKEQYGLTLIYHNHGYEFEPYAAETLYDYIVKNTNPNYVGFELDILWAFFPGQDPAQLLKKYRNRYKALHLKDLKKGVIGNNSGGTSIENDVVLGTGQINLPAVLKAARKAGVQHYYIEDESSNSITQVPESIKYLHNLKK